MAVIDVVRSAGEARIEAAQEVEDELRFGDGTADVAERIGGGLHLLAVLVDGGVALGHGVELVTQEDGTWGLVGVEETLDGDLELVRGLVRCRSEAEDVGPDSAEEPAANTGVRNGPSRVSGSGRRRAVNVREEAKFPTEGGEERRPLVEVWVLQLQGHRDMGFDGDCRVGSDEHGGGRGGLHSRHGGRGVGGAGGRGGGHDRPAGEERAGAVGGREEKKDLMLCYHVE